MVKDVSSIISSDVSNKSKIDPIEISKKLILRDINGIRSNLQLKDKTDPKEKIPFAPMKESYCHAFYRILGLPVISADKTRFYNPGYSGMNSSSSDEAANRKAIDDNQDPGLLIMEGIRESTTYNNTNSFNNVATKIQYRLELIQYPIKINIINKDIEAFKMDQQMDEVAKRTKYKPTRKILRPFKCTPGITNNILPVTNNICAPFMNDDDTSIRDVSLNKPYLEFVARIRFSKDIRSKTESNKLIEALKANISSFNNDELSKMSTEFNNTLKGLSALELYIIEKMLTTLYYICKKTYEEKGKASNIVERLQSLLEGESISSQKNEIRFDTLDKWIKERQSKIDEMELILSQIPNYSIPGIGLVSNPIKNPLISSFIEFIQPEINTLKKEVNELNAEKQKRLSLFNSINSELFYMIGEVNGLGLIDIIVMMLSFWLIKPEELLAMFDEPSFERLYNNTQLRVDIVEARKSSGVSKVSIAKAMGALDKTISTLLEISEALIETNKSR